MNCDWEPKNLEFRSLLSADPNALLYFVTNTRTGDFEQVRFEFLTLDDAADLAGVRWSGAVFGAVWPNYLQTRLGTEPFYKALGFTPAPRLPRRYLMVTSGAEALLQKSLLMSEE